MSESPSVPNPVPPWTSAGDATRLVLQGYTFRTGIRVAAVVGTILSLANQGGLMLSGHLGMAAVVRVGVNYLVPFVVSSVGYLAPFRVSANKPGTRRRRIGHLVTFTPRQKAIRSVTSRRASGQGRS